jgi:hypothetical protein
MIPHGPARREPPGWSGEPLGGTGGLSTSVPSQAIRSLTLWFDGRGGGLAHACPRPSPTTPPDGTRTRLDQPPGPPDRSKTS